MSHLIDLDLFPLGNDGSTALTWDHRHKAVFKTADLLDALGAVPTAYMAREIAEAQREADRWQTAAEENERWADEWKRKAEESEANAAAQIETVGKLRAERDEWKARAQVAEAAMSAVLAVVDQHPDPCDAPGREYSTCGWKRAFQDVHAIVHPKPAFTLPTEAGAIGIATFNCVGTEYTKPIRLCRNGTWCSVDEKQYFQPEDIIDFKPAKIVEADQ